MDKPPLQSKTSLPRLTVRSFRCFRDAVKLVIRPLTLVYGRNQAGKSSLLRLLAVLSDSLHREVHGLDWSSPALGGASFKELGWLGKEPSLSPWLGLSVPHDSGCTWFSLQFTDVRGPTVNAVRVGVSGEERRFDVTLAGDVSMQDGHSVATYAGRYCGEPWEGELRFSGLFPVGLPGKSAKDLDLVDRALRPLRQLQWLHANRLDPMRIPARRSQWCRPDGVDLADALAANEAAVSAVSQWLSSRREVGERLYVGRDAEGHNRLELYLPGRERLPLQLAGEGVRSLLPVLAAVCAADSDASDAPTMLAVEEPEAHLHPTLQVALMERILDTVRRGVPVVIETHSPYLLRTVQLAVLKGDIAANDVALHWLSREEGHDGAATVRLIQTGDDGSLVNWQPGTFEEEQRLAREIIERRWRSMVTS